MVTDLAGKAARVFLLAEGLEMCHNLVMPNLVPVWTCRQLEGRRWTVSPG